MTDVRIYGTITHPELIQTGDHVSIDMGVYISTALECGDYVHIAPYACIIGGLMGTLRMGDFTNISAGAKVIVVSDSFKEGLLNPIVPVKYRTLIGHTTIMELFTALGVNAVLMPGCNMAIGSVAGAGAVVTKSTEPWGIYVGCPARLVGHRDKESVLKAAKELGYEY